ncbi:AraC family transcriptional regulator [Paenibacillus sp. IITD108]|uniref:AraC family transcriptional regulator n=1 Tax=Paenibacillus sp. IITD108 TaxID=3116649 RepID=UPI002F4210DF
MIKKLARIKKITFKKKILIYCLFLSIIPVTLLGMISSYTAVKSIQSEVDTNNRIILKQIEYQLNAFLAELKTLSLQVSEDLIIQNSLLLGISTTPKESFEATMNMMSTVSKYRSVTKIPFGVTLVYTDYDQIYSTIKGLSSISNFNYRQLIQTYNPKYFGVSVITPNTYLNQNELLIVKQVSVDYSTAGIVILHVDIKRMYEYLQSIEMGNIQVLIVDDQGKIVLSPRAEEIGARLTLESPIYSVSKEKAGISKQLVIANEKYNATTIKSTYNNWTYIAMTPMRELTNKANDIRNWTWGMAAFLVIFWGCISFLSYRSLYMPIYRIMQKLPRVMKAGTDDVQAIHSYMDDVVEKNNYLKDQLQQEQQQVREHVMKKLIHGEISAASIQGKLQQYNLVIEGKSFYICVVDVDQVNAFKQRYLNNDRNLIMYALNKVIQELCDENDQIHYITSNVQICQVLLILGLQDSSDDSEQLIRQLCGLIRYKIQEIFQFTVSIAVSRETNDPYYQINDLYEQTLQLLGYRHLIGVNSTISCQDVEALSVIDLRDRNSAKWHKMTISCLMEGNVNEAEEMYMSMLDILPLHVPDFKMFQGILTYSLDDIGQFMYERMGCTFDEVFENDVYQDIFATTSLDEMKEWFSIVFFPAIRKKIEHMELISDRKTVDRTIEYIHNHYESDLSLQAIASELGMSTSQLSKVFKKQENINFVDYVINFKMNKAKEWLVYTDLSIKEISDKLQYTTTQNFTRVFKQITGIPPGKYRSDYRSGKSDEAERLE